MEKLIAPKSNPKNPGRYGFGFDKNFRAICKTAYLLGRIHFLWGGFLNALRDDLPEFRSEEQTLLDIGTKYVTIIHG